MRQEAYAEARALRVSLMAACLVAGLSEGGTMSIALAEGEVGNFQECVHRDLLTYVSYPAFKGASRCFAYP